MNWLKRLLRNDGLDAAFETLSAGMDTELATSPASLVEIERKKSDATQDELRGCEIALETRIAALAEELRQVRKVLKAEILRARELDTDGGYSPELDAAGSYTVAIEAKRRRGDKHFRKPAEPAREAAE